MRIAGGIASFGVTSLCNGVQRPTRRPNAWVADLKDPKPRIELRWNEVQTIRRIELSFDTDFDHPLESVLLTHPETVIPFCVRNYRILDASGRLIHETFDNHQTTNRIDLGEALTVEGITIECEHPDANIPASLFQVIVD